jgi:hypothetical protein
MKGIGPDRLTRAGDGWYLITMENSSITVTGTVTTAGLNMITSGIMIGKTGTSTTTAGNMTATEATKR